ncbi:MAG: hypothetical protein HYV07_03145 [Deltaproteobacteria bacterium]|nr:hypothetical protein [Deltaproteobacteria bacterium]
MSRPGGKRSMLRGAGLAAALLWFFFGVFFASNGVPLGAYMLHVPLAVLIGVLSFPLRSLRSAAIDGTEVAVFLALLLLFTLAVDRLVRALAHRLDPPVRWETRHSVLFVGAIGGALVTAMATAGVAHQLGALMRLDSITKRTPWPSDLLIACERAPAPGIGEAEALERLRFLDERFEYLPLVEQGLLRATLVVPKSENERKQLRGARCAGADTRRLTQEELTHELEVLSSSAAEGSFIGQ